MQVNSFPWEKGRKDRNYGRRQGGGPHKVLCGFQKPPNIHPLLPEREGEASVGVPGGGRARAHSLQSLCPPITTSRGFWEGGLWARGRGLKGGTLVLQRAGEGRWRGLGLSRGWSHTCTASPRSRWAAAGTRLAMRTLVRSELCAPSSPAATWGTASRPQPSPAPGPRAACANACSPCQRCTRNRTRSGHPSRCWDPWPRAPRGNRKPTRMAKVADLFYCAKSVEGASIVCRC